MSFEEGPGACAWCMANVLMRRRSPPHGLMALLLILAIVACGPLTCLGGLGGIALIIIVPVIVLIWIFMAIGGGSPWLCTRCGRRAGTYPKGRQLLAVERVAEQAGVAGGAVLPPSAVERQREILNQYQGPSSFEIMFGRVFTAAVLVIVLGGGVVYMLVTFDRLDRQAKSGVSANQAAPSQPTPYGSAGDPKQKTPANPAPLRNAPETPPTPQKLP